ncbi:hypothetical protein [Methanosarcina sp.]|jgi:hypothetical protein|uniref:hypothetical protein n=1 Tax=Methanosarcina sp. TaxID=2213 RepID=UPI002BEE95FE|nr:hypothetical protein [Methanosarcina sp.]HOW13267.1 hypothetical protein [Methanosarcina sp.]
MDLITIYKENFTIFIGIFVALAVMGTTSLYDRYKSKGGASFDFKELKLFSGSGPKITAIGSKCLKQFSEFCKKPGSFIQKKSSSAQKKSGLIQSNSVSNYLEQLEAVLLKVKDAVQKLFVSIRGKMSSLSSSLPRKNIDNKEKFVPLSDSQKEDLKSGVTDKVNSLDKVVESKKDELDFDDDLLTKMSSSNALTGSSPELKTVEPPAGEISSDLDMSFDNDFKLDENEFAIKVEGLDNEPAPENNFAFSENTAEIKFGDEKDNLLDSLKKDIVVKKEKKINFMDNMQGENLDVKLIKSDLEGVLTELNKYKQYHKS